MSPIEPSFLLRVTGCLLIAGALILFIWAHDGVSQELDGAAHAELPSYHPRLMSIAPVDERAGPFVSRSCEFTRAELEAFNDDEAARQVSHAVSVLRANDAQLYLLAVHAQPERAKNELFISSPVIVFPSAEKRSTLQSVETTVASLRLCSLRRIKQFGPFASAARSIVSAYTHDPNIRQEALSVLPLLEPRKQGRST